MLPDNVRFFVADTETTGVDETAKACEIGWVEIDEDFNILEKVESIIDPQCLIPPGASAVHGLTNADCESYPTIEEFFSEKDPTCYGHKIEDPVVLIGHRISFDVRFLSPYFTNIQQEFCTLRWLRKIYPEMDNHQLSTAIFALNLPRSEGAHRVMADVMTAYHLAQHLCERTGMGLRQIAQASAEPMLMRKMPFGKHKDSLFSDVPPSYLKWMLREMKDLDMDIKHTIHTALGW